MSMFLNAPHDSHRHEAKLLEEYAGEKDSRKIYREEHSPYPYYICALTWFMFEKFFREDRVESRYRTYKSHLFLIFKFSVGEFSPNLNRSKGIDSFCDKMLNLLGEDKFEDQIKKVIKVFDKTKNIWTKDINKSRHGIKDNREFTELLIAQSRESFMGTSVPEVVVEVGAVRKGKILRMKWDGDSWFGFIKIGGQFQNIYFNKKGYSGEIRNLIPGFDVEFELAHGTNGDFAKNVKIV